MKMDLDKQGMTSLFKEWEAPILEKLLSKDIEMGTAEAQKYTNEVIFPKTISRTSVVFALQDFEGEGYLFSREEPCKGGTKTVYWRRITLDDFWKMIYGNVKNIIPVHILEETTK